MQSLIYPVSKSFIKSTGSITKGFTGKCLMFPVTSIALVFFNIVNNHINRILGKSEFISE